MSDKAKIHNKSLDALLDGSLSNEEAKSLIALLDNEESHDENIFMRLGIVKAPETLRNRLREIPRKTRQGKPLFQYRITLALIIIPIIAVLLVLPRQSSDVPSPDEIEQARQELAIAFDYLQYAGRMTDVYVMREVGQTLQNAIVTGVNHGIN